MLVETRGRKDSNKIHNREFHLKINKKKKKKKKEQKTLIYNNNDNKL